MTAATRNMEPVNERPDDCDTLPSSARRSGIVGAVYNGVRLTEGELDRADAKGRQWEAERLAAGEPLPRPSR